MSILANYRAVAVGLSLTAAGLSLIQCGTQQPKISQQTFADPANYHSRPQAACNECHTPELAHEPRGYCGTCHSYPDWSKIK